MKQAIKAMEESYKEGCLQGYQDAIKHSTKITKEVITKAGNKLYEAVKKELYGEEKE